ASDATLLVAELQAVDGNCERALWARSTNRPPPRIYLREDTPADVLARVTREIRKLRLYKNTQRIYEAFVKADFPSEGYSALGVTRDWEHFDGASPDVAVWKNAADTLITYRGNSGGCGDFYGSLWVVFRVCEDGSLKIVAKSEASSVPDDFS